jgi:antitoxin component YwqK of YwqJK toxin-antitoxin module
VQENKPQQSNFPSQTLNGVYEIFDSRTNVYIEAKFERGIMHGSYKEYFDKEKKKLHLEGRFEDGMKQGVWTTYNRKGKVEGVAIYNKGELLERTLYEFEEK